MPYQPLSPTPFTLDGIPAWRAHPRTIPVHPELREPRLRQVRQLKDRPVRFASSVLGLTWGLLVVVLALVLFGSLIVHPGVGNFILTAILGVPMLRRGIPIVRDAQARMFAANERETITAYVQGVTLQMDRYIGESSGRTIGEQEFSSITFKGAGDDAEEPRVLEVTAGHLTVVIVGSAGDEDHLALVNLWISRMAQRVAHEIEQGKPFAWARGLALGKHGVIVNGNQYPWHAVSVQDGVEEYRVASRTGPPFSVTGATSEGNWWVGFTVFVALAGSKTEDGGAHGGERAAQANSADHQSFDRQRVKDLAVLGLDESADDDAIRNAFRRLVKVHHPDRFAQSGPEAVKAAEQSFILLREAFERLTEVRARA